MASTGKQSPLGINALGSFLKNTGLVINPVAAGYMGSSKNNETYTFGSIVQNSSLRLLTWAINDGYNRGPGNSNATLTNATYDDLISIGAGVCPALGNAVSPKYTVADTGNIWTTQALTYATQQGVSPALPGPANSGYGITSNIDNGQEATWYPYDITNINASVTQWGFLRLFTLQAWNEFNWNGSSPTQTQPQFKDFLASFMSFNSFLTQTNKTINAAANANKFMQGAYSNMSDLISGDITGVSLSASAFGTDLTNLGKAIDLKNIATFGTPSALLATIGKNGAMTQDLGLALLAAGLSNSDIASITSGNIPNSNKNLEQKIYGAFLIIVGENLNHILAPLQCQTTGLQTLADLLNVKKIFPNSYASLTVPVYNGTTGLPTNSKTYYPIYLNGGVNPGINTTAVQNYIGTIIPPGQPPIFEKTSSPGNYQNLPKGFGSYLDGIIPADQAVAAGAFSYSMRQIKHISSINFSKFAKVAAAIENTADLPLTSGTDKPTNQDAINAVQSTCGSGSGVNGTYTMSDFFGCMSGLPYPWQLIDQRISQLDNATLYNIYQQLFLAVTWEPATAVVTYTTSVVDTVTYYHVTGITLTSPGGGYGRGNSPVPNVTISNGATAIATIGTDDSTAASVDGGQYGRVISLTLTGSGTDSTTIPTVSIECPPITGTGGTNTPAGTVGWPSPMNDVVEGYITQANAEISTIVSKNQSAATHLNTYWDTLGTQLAIEQRARYTASPPVKVPVDLFTNPYPSTINTFVDSMTTFAQDTAPHMAAQTLEAISDLNSVGGQSAVGMMRQERNQARLQKIGIDPDNNIPDSLPPATTRALTANGTAPGAVAGIPSPNGNIYTNPAWPTNTIDNSVVNPIPSGIYVSPVGFQQTAGVNTGDITPILDGNPNPVVNPLVPSGPAIIPTSPVANIVIIAPPAQYNPNNLPTNLNPNYTNSTLLPSTLSVPQAIEHVVTCNCDCWMG
jgi:hypothetical protein